MNVIAATETTLAAQNFAKWNDALLTGIPSHVADLYAENMTLLPTMAQEIITDRKGVEAYFVFFLQLKPIAAIVEEHTVTITDTSYLHCGMYRFTLTSEGKTQDVDARFSMLWQKHGDEWQIVHHHSSRLP